MCKRDTCRGAIGITHRRASVQRHGDADDMTQRFQGGFNRRCIGIVSDPVSKIKIDERIEQM